MSDIPAALFPSIRLRRTRRSASLRALVAETVLSPADLIYPVFVLDGEGRTENVESMPGIERKSIDGILEDAALAASLGIPAIALFPVIDTEHKSPDGDEDTNANGRQDPGETNPCVNESLLGDDVFKDGFEVP